MKKKCLILERIDSKGLDLLRKKFDVTEFYEFKRDKVINKIKSFQIIIIKSYTKIDKNFLDKAKTLEVVGRAGTGLDNIDINYAKKKKVKVFSVPKGNTIATAEFIISVIFLIVKKLFFINSMISKNDFSRHLIKIRQVQSLNFGIIGIGNVGIEVSKRLRPFGSKIFGYDPFSKKIKNFKQIGGQMVKNFILLLRKSDVLIICSDLNKTSEFILNMSNITYLKRGCILINCARAKIIEEKAILYSLDRNIISSAAIDIVDPEPFYGKKNQKVSKIINHPKVFYSPHIAGQTIDSQKKIAFELVKKIEKYLDKKI